MLPKTWKSRANKPINLGGARQRQRGLLQGVAGVHASTQECPEGFKEACQLRQHFRAGFSSPPPHHPHPHPLLPPAEELLTAQQPLPGMQEPFKSSGLFSKSSKQTSPAPAPKSVFGKTPSCFGVGTFCCSGITARLLWCKRNLFKRLPPASGSFQYLWSLTKRRGLTLLLLSAATLSAFRQTHLPGNPPPHRGSAPSLLALTG